MLCSGRRAWKVSSEELQVKGKHAAFLRRPTLGDGIARPPTTPPDRPWDAASRNHPRQRITRTFAAHLAREDSRKKMNILPPCSPVWKRALERYRISLSLSLEKKETKNDLDFGHRRLAFGYVILSFGQSMQCAILCFSSGRRALCRSVHQPPPHAAAGTGEGSSTTSAKGNPNFKVLAARPVRHGDIVPPILGPYGGFANPTYVHTAWVSVKDSLNPIRAPLSKAKFDPVERTYVLAEGAAHRSRLRLVCPWGRLRNPMVVSHWILQSFSGTGFALLRWARIWV